MTDPASDAPLRMGAWAYAPILVFLGLSLGSGVVLAIAGVDRPFAQVPMAGPLMAGVVVAFAQRRGVSYEAKLNAFTKGIADGGAIGLVLCFAMIGLFAAAARSAGCVDAVVGIGLSFIPPDLLVPGMFMLSFCIAISTGTCFGTVVALAPIGQGVIEAASLDPGLTMAALYSGGMLAVNLSPTSQSTIAAARLTGLTPRAKVAVNAVMCVIAGVVACAAFFASGGEAVSIDISGERSVVKALPYVCVLVASFAGMNVFAVLTMGTIAALAVGAATGSISYIGFMQAAGDGLRGIADAVYITLFVTGICGVIEMNGGVEWLVGKISKRVSSRSGAELAIGAMNVVLTAAILDNVVAMITTSHIAIELSERWRISRRRLANVLDLFSSIAMFMVPHSSMITVLATTVGISPFQILPHMYYPMALFVILLVSVKTGLLSCDGRPRSAAKKGERQR